MRVNLYEELYNSLIDNRGIDCIWERAVVCNCINRDTGQPDFTCPICDGSGFRYLQGKKIRVAITALASDYIQNTLMLREPGTTYCTPKEDIIMGFHDRLTFPDFRCTFSEVIKWDKDEDGLGLSHRTYRNIKQVIFLADSKYEYEDGVDFEVTEDSYHIRWLNKEYAETIDQTNMSILYYTTPTYLVDDLLHELRATMSDRNSPTETFRELPKQYKLKREDFSYGIKKPTALGVSDDPTSTIDNAADTGEGIGV